MQYWARGGVVLSLLAWLGGCATSPGMQAFDQGDYQGAFDHFKAEQVSYNNLISDFYAKSSDENNVNATYFLGIIYLERGKQKLKQAKDQARHAIGMYQKKMIAKQDMDGMVKASLERGEEDFIRDLKKADDYFSTAAEKGHIPAINAKGVSLISQPDNTERAADWFRLAVEKGYAPAENNLAVLYYYGEDVDRDLGRAKVLFDLAIKKGNDCAAKNLQRLTSGTGRALKVKREIKKGLHLALHSPCYGILKSRARSPRVK